MEPSPLTRQPQPEVFTPKIVQLYDSLFKQDDDADKSEGYWREFFALRPDKTALRKLLESLGASDILRHEGQTKELVAKSIETVKSGRNGADFHALETLNVFLVCVLGKKYSQPSSDMIAVLAGIDNVDDVLTDFVLTLDGVIRSGKNMDMRQKAVEVLLAFTAGAHQTTLLTYLIQRDLFPSIMKFIQDSDVPRRIFPAFTLLGLLANYNKFEFQNPYQMRLNDFVNEATIQKIIRCVGYACQGLRAQYLEVQEDIPEAWTLGGTLNMIGLGAIVPGPKLQKKLVYDEETMKHKYSALPGPDAAVLLATYDFAHANKLFCSTLVSLPPEKGGEQAFASYVSLTSYLLQHAHLSARTTNYAHLGLMVFRLLVEDGALCKRICGDEVRVPVRLCRQRPPYLPLVRGDRVLATAVLDAMADGVTHNLRRRLDVPLHTLCVGILLRVLSHLSRTRTRLAYHWSDLFRSLLSLVRFLAQYADDVRDLPRIETLLDHVVNVLALGLSAGESFLPTPAAYDDLFYKVVEAGDVLVRFRDSFGLGGRKSNSIETLLSVNAHYKQMLADGVGTTKARGGRAGAGGAGGVAAGGGQLTSLQVAEVIKQGYETLSIQASEGLDTWEKYREADERNVLKKMSREAVADTRLLLER